MQAGRSISAGFLLALHLVSEDGGDMILRKIRVSPNVHDVTTQTTVLFKK
jgi:hypothetical protein